MIDLEQDQLRGHRESICVDTRERLEFIDITDRVAARVPACAMAS